MIASVAILAAAAALVGQPVNVTCHSGEEWRATAERHLLVPNDVMAFAYLGQPRVFLRGKTCKWLDRPNNSNRKRFAIHVKALGHELAHVMGEVSEKEAECKGAAWSKRLARDLGHPKPYRVREWAVWFAGTRQDETRCALWDR